MLVAVRLAAWPDLYDLATLLAIGNAGRQWMSMCISARLLQPSVSCSVECLKL